MTFQLNIYEEFKFDLQINVLENSQVIRFDKKSLNKFMKETKLPNLCEIITYIYSTKNMTYYNIKECFDEENIKYKLYHILETMYFKWFIYQKKNLTSYVKFYKVLRNEYFSKYRMDNCLKEILSYTSNNNIVREFYKNDMLWRIQHIMFLNIDIAKKFGYEFLPKGFRDTL